MSLEADIEYAIRSVSAHLHTLDLLTDRYLNERVDVDEGMRRMADLDNAQCRVNEKIQMLVHLLQEQEALRSLGQM